MPLAMRFTPKTRNSTVITASFVHGKPALDGVELRLRAIAADEEVEDGAGDREAADDHEVATPQVCTVTGGRSRERNGRAPALLGGLVLPGADSPRYDGSESLINQSLGTRQGSSGRR